MMFALLLLSMLTSTFTVQLVRSSPTTIVVPDDYSTIQSAINAASPGDTVYVRAGTYHEHVTVDKPLSLVGENTQNTTIDAGGIGNAVNITADHVTVMGFTTCCAGIYSDVGIHAGAGIRLENASYCNVFGNNVTASDYEGILLESSCNNSIAENDITANDAYGILLHSSSGNTFAENNITNNGYGVMLFHSSNNNVARNTVAANHGSGIGLSNSSGNIVASNEVTANGYGGIQLDNSSSNSLVGNKVSANSLDGIEFSYSFNNSVAGNNIEANGRGITLGGSSNNSVAGNSIVSNNPSGIYLDYSSYNSISSNNVASNVECGIKLMYSSNNSIYRNNFLNSIQVYNYTEYSLNSWDDGSVGNYWGDFLAKYPNATQISGSGVWNTPYVIDANNVDQYPLANHVMIPEFPTLAILLACEVTCFAGITSCRRKQMQRFKK
jgi:parallel beta-helix repeat protein